MTSLSVVSASGFITSGKRGKAKRALIEILRQEPENERAWLLLARCATSKRQKLYCLETVLEINPRNAIARKAIARFRSDPPSSPRRKILFGSLALSLSGIVIVFALVAYYQNVNAVPIVNEEIVSAPEVSTLTYNFFQSQPIEKMDKAAALDGINDLVSPSSSANDLVGIPEIPEAYCVPRDTQRDNAEVIQVLAPDILLVQINGEQFPVRYIGLDVSSLSEEVSLQIMETNQTLVGEIVTLVRDETEVDPDGIFPRYVFIGDTFVNYQLVEWGLGMVTNDPLNNDCFGFLLTAQNNAQAQRVGVWARPLPEDWQDWPVVPEISEYSKLVYTTGLVTGNDPNSFSVIGDCQSLSWRFLGRIDWDSYSLPEGYGYLQNTVNQFAGDFSRDFITVRDSASVATMFSVLWADPQKCGSAETPLECEFRLNKPSIVIISLGTNWKSKSVEEFEYYLREIVQFSLDHNVLPIIATKVDSSASDFPLNKIMAQAAYDFDIPMWNFWAAVQQMPFRGMDPDDPWGIHILNSAFPVKRITALQSLQAVLDAAETYTP